MVRRGKRFGDTTPIVSASNKRWPSVPLEHKNENLIIKVGTTRNIKNQIGGLSLELGIKTDSAVMIAAEICIWLQHAHSIVSDAFQMVTTKRIRSYWGLS